MNLIDGQLVYFVYGRHKELQKGNSVSDRDVCLGRILGSALPGFHRKTDDLMSNMYKVTHLTSGYKERTIDVYEDDCPLLFPLQSKTVVEQVHTGSLNWKEISTKNPRKIVVMTFQDCTLETTGTVKEIYNRSGAQVAQLFVKQYKLLEYNNILSKNPVGNKGYNSKLFVLNTNLLSPVYLSLVGIRKNLKKDKKDNYGRPINNQEYSFVVKIPKESLNKENEFYSDPLLTTYYLGPKALGCTWFEEDYEEFLATSPSEPERTSVPAPS